MRAVVQRVSKASVKINGSTRARIGSGLLVFLAVERGDTEQDVEYLAEKVVNLRVFPDKNRRMNLALKDVGGQLLVVSQFTLAGDCRKGRRPSFDRAEEPKKAEGLYKAFVEACRSRGVKVATGEFRQMMDITLTNTGPVTLLLSTRKEF